MRSGESIAVAEDNAYVQLREKMEHVGLFKKRPFFYAIYSIILVAGTVLSLYIITLTPHIVIQTFNALLLSIILMQFGFLGHDIAHRQVFSSKILDRWVGSTVYALFLGISLDHWYGGHREHHAHTNQIGKDPDINLPLVFTEEQFATWGPTFKKYFLPWQHIYFFPFMSLAYLNYTIQSLPWDIRKLKHPIRQYELLLTATHFAIFFFIVFTYLPFWMGVYFLSIIAVVGGTYAGFSFAPNHKGEEVLTPDEKVTYRTEIISTRNLYPSPFMDLAVGGLNYQIEHHLFSNMPRPNLAKAQKFVKEFCIQEGLPYHETTFAGSVVEMYQTLRHFAGKSKQQK